MKIPCSLTCIQQTPGETSATDSEGLRAQDSSLSHVACPEDCKWREWGKIKWRKILEYQTLESELKCQDRETQILWNILKETSDIFYSDGEWNWIWIHFLYFIINNREQLENMRMNANLVRQTMNWRVQRKNSKIKTKWTSINSENWK